MGIFGHQSTVSNDFRTANIITVSGRSVVKQTTYKVFDDVSHSNRLATRVYPAGTNHNGKVLHQVTQHLKWRSSRPDDIGGS
jgi:hypothetical protein